MVYPDHTDDKKLVRLLRRMRNYNPIPHRAGYLPPLDPPIAGYRNLTLTKIIEDPHFKDSKTSLLTQATDLAAFLLYQHIQPNAYMKRHAGHRYFDDKLGQILCKQAARDDPRGIVWV